MSRKVRYHCSLGSLVPFHDEPLTANLRRVRSAGFDGVESGPPGERERRDFTAALSDLGMSFGVAAYFPEDADPEPTFAAAARCGALYVEAQVDGYWQSDDWIDARTDQLITLGRTYGLPFYLETHRGRYTQDPKRTVALLGRLPAVRLCGDFSHYTSTSELKAPWPEVWREQLATIAAHCDAVHLRLNAGQRVQDPLVQVNHEQRAEFLRLYQIAYRSGDRDVPFIVTSELLGPDYQWTDPTTGQPIGDLWAETVEVLAMTKRSLANENGESSPLSR